MPIAEHSTVFHADIDTCFDVIVDFSRYPEFLPEMREVEVLSQRANAARVRFVVDAFQRVEYQLDLTWKRPKRVSWTLHGHCDQLKRNSGKWLLEQMVGGDTAATYHMDLQPSGWMPDFVVKGMLAAQLPVMMAHFSRRIKKQTSPVSAKTKTVRKGGRR